MTADLKTFCVPVLAGIGWLLTVILITQLLGGVFDARQCTTACMQTLYWTAFAVTVIGLLIGIAGRSIRHDTKNHLGLAALAGLLLIFLVMMAIGTFA